MATKTELAAIQKRIKDAERQLEEDRQLAESMRTETLKSEIEKFAMAMASMDFQPLEVLNELRDYLHVPPPARKKTSAAAAKKSVLAGVKAPPKYKDPATGQTWSGRGQKPRWMQPLLEAGKKVEDFLIDAPTGRKKGG